MFKRQTRSAFPPGAIFVLIAIVVAFLVIILRQTRQETAPPAPENEEADGRETSGNQTGGLRPAEWFYAMRNYPDFKPDLHAYTTALEMARDRPASASRPRDQFPGFGAPWTVEGPGNIGARVNAIAVHPTNPSIVYIGYSGGGLWKTVNGGQSWTSMFDDQPFLAIGDIALDPQDPQTVYVGTGDPNISGYPFIGDGVWKSTDGGQTWQHLGLETQRIISSIIVHPTNSDILYAAAMGLPFERNTQRGVYRSADGGQSWQQVLFISDSTGIIDLKMAPGNPDVLYAAGWDRIRNNQESIVTGLNSRIWKTTNGGTNWTILGGSLPDFEISRPGIAIDPQNPDRLLAVYAGEDLGFHGIYETANGGQNWQINAAEGLNSGFQGNFAWYFGKVYVNPFNPQDLWVLGVNSYRSKDGGQNWSQATNGPHVDHHALAFLDATTFLLGTDGGLYRSDDDGQSWYRAEQIPTTQFYRVAANPFQPELYYGGAQDNGTVGGSHQNVNGWEHLFGGDGFQAAFHPSNPDVFYFEWQNGNIVGTVDGGAWFDGATTGIEESDRRHWDMPYMISRHDPEVMYSGTYRIYSSYDHPPAWSAISPDLTDGVIFGERFHTISTLDESPVAPEHLYAGTTDGNVWRGHPGTQSWTNVTAGLPNRYVSSVKASPYLAERVFVTHSGYRSNDFSPLVHRSDNGGATWVSISGDLPPLAVNDIQVLPGHQDSVIFVATDGGVWGTLNGGVHWERLGAGLPVVPVYDIDLNPAKKTLFAGTHARSILSFPLDSLNLGGDVSTENPDLVKRPVLLVSPSLADQSTVIAIEHLSLKKQADIAVFDLSGRLMRRFELRGGSRSEMPVELQDFPPGVYVAVARTDGKVWGQRKFVVAR